MAHQEAEILAIGAGPSNLALAVAVEELAPPPRNPLSRFSFINYLHSAGKLDDFINIASFLPFRLEISDYLQWVAKSLAMVRIEYSRDCVGIEPVMGDGATTTKTPWHRLGTAHAGR